MPSHVYTASDFGFVWEKLRQNSFSFHFIWLCCKQWNCICICMATFYTFFWFFFQVVCIFSFRHLTSFWMSKMDFKQLLHTNKKRTSPNSSSFLFKERSLLSHVCRCCVARIPLAHLYIFFQFIFLSFKKKNYNNNLCSIHSLRLSFPFWFVSN